MQKTMMILTAAVAVTAALSACGVGRGADGPVAQACMAGVGVALLPLFLIASEIGSGQLVIAFDHPVRSPRSYYLISPRARARLATVLPFHDGGAS